MKKLLLLIGAFAVLLGVPGDRLVEQTADRPRAAMPKLDRDSSPKMKCSRGTGTGVVISRDTMLTASHVVTGGKTCTVQDTNSNDGSPATLDHDDVSNDFATMRGRFRGKPVEVNCGGFVTGETYYINGYPYGNARITVPAVATSQYANSRPVKGPTTKRLRELNGSSHPGMSGGPIIDGDGRVVGIVSARPVNDRSITMAKELKDTFICADK